MRRHIKAIIIWAVLFSFLPLSAATEQLSEITKELMPAVVTVYTEKALGSGFIVDREGYILTNAHIVSKLWDDPEAIDDPFSAFMERVTVILQNKNRYPAEVVGYDARTDIGLLKIHPREKLMALKLGDSGTVKTGQRVIAMGSPLGLEETATVGVVSHVGRPFSAGPGWEFPVNVIQTDAAINPGNSGGPMVNAQGEVIGINYATTAKWASEGVGFAIPINVAKYVKKQLLSNQRVIYGYLGLGLHKMSREYTDAFGIEKGILVEHVDRNSPAEDAGIRSGDVIVSLNHTAVSAIDEKEVNDFQWIIKTSPPGKEVLIEILRKDNESGLWKRLSFNPRVEKCPPSEIELRPYVYDDVGFTVKRITELVYLKYNLSFHHGVWISSIGTGPAKEAELRVGDVITKMGHVTIKTPHDLKISLLNLLRNREKYIRMTVHRGKIEMPVFLKMEYPLKHKEALVVFLSDKIPAELYDILEMKLLFHGVDLTLSALNGEKITLTGDEGRFIQPEQTILSLSLSGYEGILFLSGTEERDYLPSEREAISRLVVDAAGQGKVIGGIGSSVLLLLKAKPGLATKKITADEKYLSQILNMGGNVTGRPAEADRNLITATGQKESFKPFAYLFIKQLLNRSK